MITHLSYFLFFSKSSEVEEALLPSGRKGKRQKSSYSTKKPRDTKPKSKKPRSNVGRATKSASSFSGQKKEMKIRKAQRADRVATKLSYAATALG